MSYLVVKNIKLAFYAIDLHYLFRSLFRQEFKFGVCVPMDEICENGGNFLEHSLKLDPSSVW